MHERTDLQRNSVEGAAYEQAQRDEPDRDRVGVDRLGAVQDLVAKLCLAANRRALSSQ